MKKYPCKLTRRGDPLTPPSSCPASARRPTPSLVLALRGFLFAASISVSPRAEDPTCTVWPPGGRGEDYFKRSLRAKEPQGYILHPQTLHRSPVLLLWIVSKKKPNHTAAFIFSYQFFSECRLCCVFLTLPFPLFLFSRELLALMRRRYDGEWGPGPPSG